MAIDAHDHSSILLGERLAKAAWRTTTTSLSGSLPDTSLAHTDITLGAYMFFPMIHLETNGNRYFLSAHLSDGGGADAARMGWTHTVATGGGAQDYDIDYRAVDV